MMWHIRSMNHKTICEIINDNKLIFYYFLLLQFEPKCFRNIHFKIIIYIIIYVIQLFSILIVVDTCHYLTQVVYVSKKYLINISTQRMSFVKFDPLTLKMESILLPPSHPICRVCIYIYIYIYNFNSFLKELSDHISFQHYTKPQI